MTPPLFDEFAQLVTEIKRFRPEPHDVLVIRLARELDAEQLDAMHSAMVTIRDLVAPTPVLFVDHGDADVTVQHIETVVHHLLEGWHRPVAVDPST